MMWYKGWLNPEELSSMRVHEKALLKSCVSKETSSDPENWSKEDSSRGQCAVIALVIHKFFGGDILRASLENVRGYEKMRSHYWNGLAGAEVDLSADQFKGDARDSVPKGEPLTGDGRPLTAEELLKNPDTKRRFEMLSERYDAVLEVLYALRNHMNNFQKKTECLLPHRPK